MEPLFLITECSPEEMKNSFRIKDAEAILRKLDPEALQKMEHLMYEVGRWMLESYGVFEQ